MKKLLLVVLAAILLIITFTACATQNEFLQEPNNSLENFEMPIPFGYAGGNERSHFLEGFDRKLTNFSMIEDRFIEYLKLSEEEFGIAIMRIFGDDVLNSIAIWDRTNVVLELPTLFSYIIHFDIPDEVVIDAIKEQDEWYVSQGLFVSYGGEPFTEEDIAVLLARDSRIVATHFATEYAIVINDRVYSPSWLYYHTSEAYRAAGITPEMLTEKLPLYAEFNFTAEAVEAFEAKLSEFMGSDVSLSVISHSES